MLTDKASLQFEVARSGFNVNGTFKCSDKGPGILESNTHSIVQMLNHFIIFANRLFWEPKIAKIINKILQKKNISQAGSFQTFKTDNYHFDEQKWLDDAG